MSDSVTCKNNQKRSFGMKKNVIIVILYTVLCAAVFAQNEKDFTIDSDGTITAYNGWDTAIVIPAQISGKQVKGIGNGAFKNMGITNLTLPDSIEYIGSEAFRDNKLTSVVIPGGVSYIGDYAFLSNQLTSLTMASNVYVVIGQEAFSKNRLTRLTLTSNAGVTIISKAFSDNQLASLTLGNNVYIGDYAFSNNQLTSITMGEKVTIIERAFANNRLTSLTMGSAGFISANAFYGDGNNKLKNLVLGAGIVIERDAFRFSQNSVNYSSYYDYMCNSRKAATYDNLAMYFEKKEGDYSFIQTKYGAVITNYTGNEGSRLQIPSKLGGVTVTGIGDRAFMRKNISRMQLPESLVFIDNGAFSYNQMASVNLPDSVTTSIGIKTFYECRSLTSAIIGNGVTKIEGGGSPNSYNCYGAFYGCSSLVSLTLGNSIKSIGNTAFYECESLISITIPDSVTNIGAWAFIRCRNLSSVNIPNNVTSIGEGTFSGCRSLTSVNIPNSVTSIGKSAFSGCQGLKSVIIPDSVTSIGQDAFQICTSLTSITIPNSVTSIEAWAFARCSNLTSVTFLGTISPGNFGSLNSTSPFDGDLRTKYLAGGRGTYTNTGAAYIGGPPVWKKQ